MHVNGSDTETFSGYTRGQRTFIAAESKARVQELAEAFHIPGNRVSRILAEACDESRYNNDAWRTTLGPLALTFHLARYKVELRAASMG